MSISKANLKLKEQKMIQKIMSIINVNKVEDPIFNAAMAEVVEICEKVLKGTYEIKTKKEIKKEAKEDKKKEPEKKNQYKSFGK